MDKFHSLFIISPSLGERDRCRVVGRDSDWEAERERIVALFPGPLAVPQSPHLQEMGPTHLLRGRLRWGGLWLSAIVLSLTPAQGLCWGLA